MKSEYPVSLPIKDIVRGDSTPPLRITNLLINGVPASLKEVRVQIRSARYDKLIHTFDTTFVDNNITISGIDYTITEKFPVTKCCMDIEITTQDDVRVTLTRSHFAITRDCTYD